MAHCAAVCQPSCVAQACAHAFRQQCPHCTIGWLGLLCSGRKECRGGVASCAATAGCPMMLLCWSSCRACRWCFASSTFSHPVCGCSHSSWWSLPDGVDQWQEVHAHGGPHAQAVVKPNAAFCNRPAQGGHARHILCHSGGLQTPEGGCSGSPSQHRPLCSLPALHGFALSYCCS